MKTLSIFAKLLVSDLDALLPAAKETRLALFSWLGCWILTGIFAPMLTSVAPVIAWLLIGPAAILLLIMAATVLALIVLCAVMCVLYPVTKWKEAQIIAGKPEAEKE